ncbi:putative ribonuclease H-like domain-containing protein [Tanacetum coccineum]
MKRPRKGYSGQEVESLSTKFPIVDWKTCVLTENFMYYQVFRGDGSSKNFKVLSEMLEDFDRQDVEELYRLVKERYSSSRPEGYDLMLWGDLYTLFESDEEDEIWKNQHKYNLISWRLCDFCGIHILLMENGLAIHMLTEKKYPLSQEMLTKMLSRKLEVDHESSQAFELISTNGVSTASTNLVLPVLINTASRKELVLLMVKAAELKIRMHGDYYGMVIFEFPRFLLLVHQRMRNHRIAKVELPSYRVGLLCESDGFILGVRGQGNEIEDLDAYDSAQAVLMANLSNYDSDVISEECNVSPTMNYTLSPNKRKALGNLTIVKPKESSRNGSNKWYQSFSLRNFELEDMEFESANSSTTAKLPILKLCEMVNSLGYVPQTAQENGTSVTKMSVHVTQRKKTNKKNDVKARSLLLMALPNEHQLTFSQYPDAKSMFSAIETRFGGNEATRKTQKTLLKQQYENFSATSAESFDSIFNIASERFLPPEWNTHVVVWMNKPEVDTMSIDDLYNNFKIIEQKVKKSTGASSGAQNLAFMTAPSISSTNDANTASPQVNSERIHEDEFEKQRFEVAALFAKYEGKRYYQRTGKKIFVNANDIAGYDKSKVECFNCHKMRHFARECRAPRSKEGQFKNQDNTRKQGNNEDTSSKAMLAIDGVGFDWSDMAEEQVLKREVACKDYEINVLKSEFEKVKQEKDGIEFKIEKFDKASKDLDQLLGSQISDKSKKGLGYSAVPPPHPLIYNRPKKLDLSYSSLDEFKEPDFKGYGPENSE